MKRHQNGITLDTLCALGLRPPLARALLSIAQMDEEGADVVRVYVAKARYRSYQRDKQQGKRAKVSSVEALARAAGI